MKKYGIAHEIKGKSYGMDSPEIEEKHYPSIHFDATELPEIKGWEVGKTYKLEITIKQTSLDVSNYRGEGKTSAGFEIHKVKVVK